MGLGLNWASLPMLFYATYLLYSWKDNTHEKGYTCLRYGRDDSGREEKEKVVSGFFSCLLLEEEKDRKEDAYLCWHYSHSKISMTLIEGRTD